MTRTKLRSKYDEKIELLERKLAAKDEALKNIIKGLDDIALSVAALGCYRQAVLNFDLRQKIISLCDDTKALADLEVGKEGK